MGGKGKKKIEIKKIEESEKRFVTFCKRRKGLFKKVEELGVLTGSRTAALVFSPAAEKPHTCGDTTVIDQYVSDSSADQLAPGPEINDVEGALKMHESINLEQINDLNELTAIQSDLERIKDNLLQKLNRG